MKKTVVLNKHISEFCKGNEIFYQWVQGGQLFLLGPEIQQNPEALVVRLAPEALWLQGLKKKKKKKKWEVNEQFTECVYMKEFAMLDMLRWHLVVGVRQEWAAVRPPHFLLSPLVNCWLLAEINVHFLTAWSGTRAAGFRRSDYKWHNNR